MISTPQYQNILISLDSKVQAGTSLVIGFTTVTIAANDDIAPSTPTALGLNFMNPSAVRGMNKSQEFFIVSITTSL